MKTLIAALAALTISGCAYTSKDVWNDYAKANNCKPTGDKQVLLAGSVYQIPQRRVVYLFECNGKRVWSDLGNYAKHNEWLAI